MMTRCRRRRPAICRRALLAAAGAALYLATAAGAYAAQDDSAGNSSPIASVPDYALANTLGEAVRALVLASPDGSLGVRHVLVIDPDTGPRPFRHDSPRDPAAAEGPLDATAVRFDRQCVTFGTVGVLAPASMTVWSTPEAPAACGQGDLPLDQALTMFLAALTDTQWTAATGAGGIGLRDLTARQRALYDDALVARRLRLDAVSAGDAAAAGQNGLWLSAGDLQAATTARIRVRVASDGPLAPVIPASQASDRTATGAAPSAAAVPAYIAADAEPAFQGYRTPEGAALANVARLVPNMAKRTQLPRGGDARLRAAVPLKAIQTVDEIVAAVAATTGLELYCDPRYAERTVLAVGGLDRPAPVGDVIDALALSLCATWRKVGPAYVLTDDLAGLGARCLLIRKAVRRDVAPLTGSLSRARTRLASRLATGVSLSGGGGPPLPTIAVEADVPDLGRVVLATIRCGGGAPVPAARSDDTATDAATAANAALPSVIAPASVDEARALVDQAAARGDRAVYCSAWRAARAYFPTSAVPAAATSEEQAVLATVIARARAKRLPVYAVVDLLRWDDRRGRRESPERIAAAADLTMDGKCSSAADPPPISGSAAATDVVVRDWVSPADPRVRTVLMQLLADLGAVRGLAGIALQDTVPPGYGPAADTAGTAAEARLDLGYTETMRLAFLRKYHVDPIDIEATANRPAQDAPGPSSDGPDLAIPGFGPSPATDIDAWNRYRRSIVDGLLRDLLERLQRSAPQLPVTVWEPAGQQASAR